MKPALSAESIRIFLPGIFPQNASGSAAYSTLLSILLSNSPLLSRNITKCLSLSCFAPWRVMRRSRSAGEPGSS